MPQITDLRQFIINWNNTFPLDKEYRKSHQIAFNSPSHRDTCQIDIFLLHLESKIYKESEENYMQLIKKEELYKKGEWISEQQINEEDLDDAFDKIEI